MKPGWHDHYYDILEFYYAEPQHLDRKRFPGQGYRFPDIKQNHLRRIEVPLNHIIIHFFLLAPNRFRNDLFSSLFGRVFGSEFALHGRGLDTDLGLGNAMQPDFVFISDTVVASIEMKLASKSSVEQVLKYALLGLAIELADNAPREHFLTVLGQGEFPKQWNKGFALS